MKIQVWKRYDENRADKPIKEGIYEQGDPRLYGLWRYLIDNGNARVHVEPVLEQAEEVVEVVEEPVVVPEQEVIEPKPKAKRPRKAKS